MPRSETSYYHIAIISFIKTSHRFLVRLDSVNDDGFSADRKVGMDALLDGFSPDRKVGMDVLLDGFSADRKVGMDVLLDGFSVDSVDLLTFFPWSRTDLFHLVLQYLPLCHITCRKTKPNQKLIRWCVFSTAIASER